MKRRVNRLPMSAVYDYTDIYGNKVYHTERRRYEVQTSTRFGKEVTTIYSMNKED